MSTGSKVSHPFSRSSTRATYLQTLKFLASLNLPIHLSGQSNLFETETGIFSLDNTLKSFAMKTSSFRIVKQLSFTYTDGPHFVDRLYKET